MVYKSNNYYGGSQYPVYRAHGLRGNGLGGFLRGFLKTIAPHVKKGLVSVGKQALHVGVNVLEDMSTNNVSFKDAFKNWENLKLIS